MSEDSTSSRSPPGLKEELGKYSMLSSFLFDRVAAKSTPNPLLRVQVPKDLTVTTKETLRMQTLNVYLAGHTQDVENLRALAKTLTKARGFPKIQCTSRWLDLVGKVDPTPALSHTFWDMDFSDINSSDALIVSTSLPKRPLRGALVEAGYAIARGIPVLVVGDNDGFGTWQHYRKVFRVNSTAEALLWLRLHFGKVEGVTSLTD